MEPQAEASPANVAAVHLKLPSFWPSDPQVWFAQVEAQLLPDGSQHNAPGSTTFFSRLQTLHTTLFRQQLIQRTAASKQRRLQQLFNTEELGDRKPTQLLRRMQQLLVDKAATIDNSFMRELFLQRLPANVRMVLASTPETTLYQLAQLADKVVEVAAPFVATVITST